MMKIPEAQRPLAKLAMQQGWCLSWLGSCHVAWRSPTGALVVGSASPSDRRAVHRLRADLRRHGLLLG
jgi:hypothetical protein